MTKPALTPRRVLLLLVLVMVLSSLMPPWVAGKFSHYPRNIVHGLTLPFVHGLTKVSNWLRPGEADHPDLGDAQLIGEQNLLLQGQVMRLQEELRTTRELLAQVADVQALTGTGVTLIEARVTAQPASRSQAVITINRGEREGVRKGMIVASGYNLVGRVTATTAVDASVMLLTQPKQPPLAVVVRAGVQPAYALATGLELAPGGEEFISMLSKDDAIKEGDLAFLDDKAWPPESRGFVVGKVVRTEPDPADPLLRRRAIVRPVRPLDALTSVMVVVPPGVEMPERKAP
jgi:rod shape-determining protein MreC